MDIKKKFKKIIKDCDPDEVFTFLKDINFGHSSMSEETKGEFRKIDVRFDGLEKKIDALDNTTNEIRRTTEGLGEIAKKHDNAIYNENDGLFAQVKNRVPWKTGIAVLSIVATLASGTAMWIIKNQNETIKLITEFQFTVNALEKNQNEVTAILEDWKLNHLEN